MKGLSFWRRVPRVFMVAAGLVLVFSLGAAALAEPNNESDDTFFACLNTFTGALVRVNTSGPPRCGWAERNVQWNGAGVPGQDGQDGQPGQDGVSGYESLTGEMVTLTAGESGDYAEVTCPEGKVPVGGGYVTSGVGNVRIADSFATGDGWKVWGKATSDDGGGAVGLAATVICMDAAVSPD